MVSCRRVKPLVGFFLLVCPPPLVNEEPLKLTQTTSAFVVRTGQVHPLDDVARVY